MMSNKPTIVFTGDLGITRKVSDCPFSRKLLCCVQSVDALCVNLELPFVEKGCRMAPYTHPSLTSYSSYSPILKILNPSVANIGTNHCMDGGGKGIKCTVDILNKYGIYPMGAGVNEQQAREPCFRMIKGYKFGFLGYCKQGNFTATSNKPGAALLSEENLYLDIKRVKDKCDFLLVSMHFGMEFSQSVHPMYRQLAHLAVDLGASCIIGHHSHVIQGIETYKGVPIFYSLGNFLFDNFAGAVVYKDHWAARHRSFLAKIFFEKSNITYELIPIIYDSSTLVVDIAHKNDKDSILSEIKTLSHNITKGITEKNAESEAVNAIIFREIKTIFILTKLHGVKFLWYFAKDLKIRHFKMLINALITKILK